MFASIRKYNVRRGSAEELAKRVRKGFVPMMRQMEGFQELLSARWRPGRADHHQHI